MHTAAIVVITALLGHLATAQAPSGAMRPARAQLASAGVCLQDGVKLAGTTPLLVEKGMPQPRKIRNAVPNYPELPEGTVLSGGMWVAEVLIGKDGRVREVWPIRELHLTPPFPAFNDSIMRAVRQWRFTPLIVDGRAQPFCMTVTTIIDIQ